ncbi:7-deoxyloganetic acid glucosyltransferase [Bertholletia excelsa]
MDQERLPSPHVLIFPLPLQGPVNSMLKLAELLCLAGLRVTFLNTHHNHRRHIRFSDMAARLEQYPSLRFATISDGLSEDHPRCGPRIMEMFESLEAATKPHFRELLVSGGFTCVIAELVMGFPLDVCEEVGVPVFCFDTISPICLWVYACIPRLIEAGELPFRGNNMDELVTNVAGMEGILRRRDLPHFCRAADLYDPHYNVVSTEIRKIRRSQGLILNTFEELDGPTLSNLRSLSPNTYAVGPLHRHLKARHAGASQSSNSVWKEDRSCMAWLDAQPEESVIYVSIRSVSMMTNDEVMELWHGLVNSGKRFLWVRRPNSIVSGCGEDQVPSVLLEATKERGCMVSWAPQEEVLAHPAIGGFLTHSGWNSTIESIVEGLPMVCWAYHIDQLVNSRFVGEVWRLGMDMKDRCDRATVEKMVRDVMEERRNEFKKSADRMAMLARASVDEEGSSFCDFNRLVDDIRLMVAGKANAKLS